MQEFLNNMAWDLIIYASTSFLHSFFLIGAGSFAAFYILLKIQTQQVSATYATDWNTIPSRFGWNYMLFGMLSGSVCYLAGNVAKNIVDEVLLSIGFRDHAYADDTKNKVTNIATVGPSGVFTTATTETYKGVLVDYDYAKLLKMQDNWSNFFGLQRFVQIVAPYFLMLALEAGVASAMMLLIFFTNIS